MNGLSNKLLDQPVKIELEDFYVSIFKRVYSQLDILVVFSNCLVACFSIPAAISQIPENDDFTLNQYQFCTWGPPTSVTVSCPYFTSPAFLVFTSWCVLYFITFFLYRFFWTFEYYSNDLRFYLACDLVNFSRVTKLFIIMGILFTVSGGLVGLAFMFINGSTSSIGTILTFVAVNLFTFFQMWRSDKKNSIPTTKEEAIKSYDITRLMNIDLHSNPAFKNPIPLKLPMASESNFSGAFVNHRDIFDCLVQAALVSALSGNDQPLREIGDPKVIGEALVACMPNLYYPMKQYSSH